AAALVALPLVIAEVDRTARPLATVRDLVVAFGDRGLDAALAQPGPVLLRRVALVREHPVRSRARGPSAGDVDLVEYAGEHARVCDLPPSADGRQRPGPPGAGQVDPCRQTPPWPADRGGRRLWPGLFVGRPAPL